jgi:FKBP-type peptidyl-prolyl cis-trans isomerase FkpA/FKBP-type peptidyl-prolyl cis-trans isomerase FklB
MRFIMGVLLTAAVGASGCHEKPTATVAKLDSDAQKASYGIGSQIGRSVLQSGIEVDTAALQLGIEDALAKKELRIKGEEIEQAQNKIRQAAQTKQAELGEKNKTEATQFLEKNKAAPGVVATASGLQYQIIKEGTGELPKDTDTVSAHYEGKLLNGEKFDSSYDRKEPADFPVTGVIAGWTEALKLMKVGSKWKLFIPPDLAYGAAGRPGIPPNSALIFEVELLAIKNPQEAPVPAGKG